MDINSIFYAVEVVKGAHIFLKDVIREDGELMVHGTTKNILDTELMAFESKDSADYIADAIKEDKFSDSPRVMKFTLALEGEVV